MTTALQRRVEAHRRSGGNRAGAARAAGGAQSGLPVAAWRGARSYYADLEDSSPALRICRGTSCELAGAAALHAELARERDCRAVYCLGYCDRSPAVLARDGVVYTQCSATAVNSAIAAPASPAPSFRSLGCQPLVTSRLALGGCAGIAPARNSGAYATLNDALRRPGEEIIDVLERSGERGRGGAAYPTAAKWRACAAAADKTRYVVANGDEGDPGSFIDRLLLEGDPHAILEGMILAGHAIGAAEGVVFVRGEYPAAADAMEKAIAEARCAGLLGESILGTGIAFDVRVVRGLGSYVCGEETALLNAIEGLRGEVRLRPPFPAVEGLRGKPTVVNNVETLAVVPLILRMGPEAYAALGTPACSGTKAMCLNHGFARPGVVEVEFGTRLRHLIEEAGGGRDNRRLKAVILGGPMGSVLLPEEWDVPICYSAMGERGIRLGHGGLVALSEETDFHALLLHWAEFLRNESCGKCVPCGMGSQQLYDLLRTNDAAPASRIARLLDVIEQASLCGFGQSMPAPIRRLVRLSQDAAGRSKR